MINIIIPGAPITKKNHSRILRKKDGTPFLAPSEQYQRYEELSGYYIHCKGLMIAQPVNVKCLYYMPTRRRVDLCNLLESTCDILTHYGVIKDDHSGIVVSHDGSRVLYDKEHPRAHIEILEV